MFGTLEPQKMFWVQAHWCATESFVGLLLSLSLIWGGNGLSIGLKNTSKFCFVGR